MKTTRISNVRATRTRFASQFCYASLFALVSTAGAANVDSLWNTGSGNWADAGNWTGGLPGNAGAGNTSRVFFDPVTGQPATYTVTVDGSTVIDYMAVAQGRNVTLQMQAGASLSNMGAMIVGRVATGASGPSSLSVTGPASGSATFDVSILQVGGKSDSSGDSLTFSGPNLTVSGGSITVGRQGNNHSLTFRDGVKADFNVVNVSANADANVSGVGNNDKLYVTGAGTELTVHANTVNGLNVGPRSLANHSGSKAPTGNAVLVSNGGTMRVIGEHATTTSAVWIGGAIYRSNNSVQVTGANSLFEVSGNTSIIIGTANDTSYSNHISVSQGGTIRSDAATTISNGPSTALNRRNHLTIGNGGSFYTSKAIDNNGGLVRLSSGGVLQGETVSGEARDITLNINGTGRFEASGDGLANNVTVNIGSGTGTDAATLAIGDSGHLQAANLTLRSTVNMKANSVLEVSFYGDGAIDSITMDAGGLFSIGSNVTLSLGLSNYTLKAGDSFQLFTGLGENVLGSFASILTPTLASDLEFDWSQFNAEGDWRFTVIPEPSSLVLLAGAGLFAFGAGLRARRHSHVCHR